MLITSLKKYKLFLLAGILISLVSLNTLFPFNEETILSYTVDPKSQDIQFYWKDENSERFGSILNLKNWLEQKNKTLVFAVNGGMFKPDHSPQGLFIQDRQIITPLDTTSRNGNFYLKPNGVFYITAKQQAIVCKTTDFINTKNMRFATQSGPMLVIDGTIHPDFKKDSKNVNIRNGVGILSDGTILFAMSKEKINFYDFANYFKKSGCKNALYLDGFVSRTFLPEKKWTQTDGDFGVIIGVSHANTK